MKCPLCAEEIQAEAVVCRFCGAVRTGDQWQIPAARAGGRPPGTFTFRFAAAAFGVSAVLEVVSFGSEVAMFGALRGGVIAYAYHGVYVVLFAALCLGLWEARTWGYRLLFSATCFYTVDNLRYMLDRTGMRAQIDRQLAAARDIVGVDSLMRTATLSVILVVACWWGFTFYAYTRRGYFAA